MDFCPDCLGFWKLNNINIQIFHLQMFIKKLCHLCKVSKNLKKLPLKYCPLWQINLMANHDILLIILIFNFSRILPLVRRTQTAWARTNCWARCLTWQTTRLPAYECVLKFILRVPTIFLRCRTTSSVWSSPLITSTSRGTAVARCPHKNGTKEYFRRWSGVHQSSAITSR